MHTYSQAVYNKGNISVVADGASISSLSKWTEQFLSHTPSSSPSGLLDANSKYHGGEQRIDNPHSNAMVIAFPGSSYTSFRPEITVLAALLGGKSNIKWSPGFSLLSKAASASPSLTAEAHNLAYSDAGLLTIQLDARKPVHVREAAVQAVNALKAIADGSAVNKEVLAKAVAKAKFDHLAASELRGTGIVLAGVGLLHGGQATQLLEATKSIEGVTAEKLKAVSVKRPRGPKRRHFPAHFTYFPLEFGRLTLFRLGRQGATRGQGERGKRRRSTRAAICGGAGSQSIILSWGQGCLIGCLSRLRNDKMYLQNSFHARVVHTRFGGSSVSTGSQASRFTDFLRTNLSRSSFLR